MSFSKLDYCQYLLSSPVNYTLTHLAEHLDGITHDHDNRYLRGEKLSPHLLWENVKGSVQPSQSGYVVFDDTMLDKHHSSLIEQDLRKSKLNRQIFKLCDQVMG